MAPITNSPPRPPRWYQSAWLRPFNDPHALDDLLQRVRPQAALSEIRARVLSVIEQSADTRSFVLRPNRHWPGFSAGQHVLVTVIVRGRRLQRCFSISSAPADRDTLEITIKRQGGSGVSAWMHAHLRSGDVVMLSKPSGEFGLPDLSEPMLMLSAGSGITPMMSMLRDLRRRRQHGDIVLVHSCRDAEDLIFATSLRELVDTLPGLRLIIHHSRSTGRLDPDVIKALVPDWTARLALVCGPAALIEWFSTMHRDGIGAGRLRVERFGLASIVAGDDAAVHAVDCLSSERSFTARAGESLLVAAELAGLAPRHGCRIGICRSCLCAKRSGRVENLLTGEICAEPAQQIQLCISRALSPLVLEL